MFNMRTISARTDLRRRTVAVATASVLLAGAVGFAAGGTAPARAGQGEDLTAGVGTEISREPYQVAVEAVCRQDVNVCFTDVRSFRRNRRFELSNISCEIILLGTRTITHVIVADLERETGEVRAKNYLAPQLISESSDLQGNANIYVANRDAKFLVGPKSRLSLRAFGTGPIEFFYCSLTGELVKFQ
jgi:hypothetical protein